MKQGTRTGDIQWGLVLIPVKNLPVLDVIWMLELCPQEKKWGAGEDVNT